MVSHHKNPSLAMAAAILVLSSLLLSLARVHGSSRPTCVYPAIFNFGDSNSDTGGLSAAFGAAGPPHGESFFGAPAGRYCDGRLIVDFIAERLGVPYLHAYLDSIGANYTYGANFATAGSTIRPQNTTLSQSGFSPFSLDVQSWQFAQFVSRSQIKSCEGGVFQDLLPKEDYFSRALYTFDIGQNDLAAAYFSGMSTAQVIANIPDMINKFATVVKSVYGQGGRYFWIHNTGPLGCLPYVLDRLPEIASHADEYGCGIIFNKVAQLFNKMLNDSIVQLRKDLPLAALTYVDVYDLKYSIFKNAQDYGFVDPLVACCGHGGKYNYNQVVGCGITGTVNGTVVEGKACVNPRQKVIWDGVHYTDAANNFIFNWLAEGVFSDPVLSLREACYQTAQVY